MNANAKQFSPKGVVKSYSTITAPAAVVTPPSMVPKSQAAPTSSSHKNPVMRGGSTSVQWLNAIQAATQCLRERPAASMTTGKPKDDRCIEESKHALKYLTQLETQFLYPHEAYWDQAPVVNPPRFHAKRFASGRSPPNKNGMPKQMLQQSPRPLPVASPARNSMRQPPAKDTSSNRFAMFVDEDDDEEEKTDKAQAQVTMITPFKGTSLFGDDTDEAGDVPMLNLFPAPVMTMRRLMIRIVTAESELYAYQASGYRRRQSWIVGAQQCHYSLLKIHEGLLLADSEISRYFTLPNGGQHNSLREALMEDASIVEVAVRSLTTERDLFVQKAQRQQQKLIRKLETEYIARQSARLKMGEKKWTSNPNPKNHGVKERAWQEQQLQEVEDALAHLSWMDTEFLQHTTDQLKERLQAKGRHAQSRRTKRNRNNQQRPFDISGRVDLVEYPDPSLFGWKFTGSQCDSPTGEKIEFFEKQGILLDWHYLTGAVELSWKHLSRQGNTTFYKSVGAIDSVSFLKLLKSPKPWEIQGKHKL